MTSQAQADAAPLRVVVAGAGVAGLEAVVALRALAQERVGVTLVDPRPDFTVRALTTGEPFGLGHPHAYPLAGVAADLGVTLVPDAVTRVDVDGHAVTLRSGVDLAYDVLLLALGARPHAAYRHGVVFDRAGGSKAFDDVLADVVAGAAREVAIVVPSHVAWTLPAYELALMTAAFGATGAPGTRRVVVVTPEREPLEAFGPVAGEMARTELAAGDVELVTGVNADVPSSSVVGLGRGRRLEVDRVVHLPLHAGPRPAGVPCDNDGFVPVDEHGRVEGADDVYAAGDGTSHALKQGGLAAQQADAAAAHIAHRAGADLEPLPYRPVLRGVLRTRRGARYMRAEPPGGHGETAISERALWWPPSKVSSRWLIPWLATREAGRADERPSDAEAFDVAGTVGHRAEHEFERSVGAGTERRVAFERPPNDRWGWRLAGVREARDVTLAGALDLLPEADRDAARRVHAAALDAACAAIAAIRADRRTAADPQRLDRLAFFNGQAEALARELSEVQRTAERGATAR